MQIDHTVDTPVTTKANTTSAKGKQKGKKDKKPTAKSPHIIGYGTASFDKSAIDDGVIVNPEAIAESALKLFKGQLIGDISTARTAMTIPSYRSYTRAIQLPALGAKELQEAVELEAEQYIPVPLEELYLDYVTINQTKDQTNLFAVAVPRKIVDSYVTLSRMLGLETVVIETTLSSAARLFALDTQSNIPSVIIDFGSLSADISIFDKTILVTGTVQGGGEVFTNSIRDKLGVTQEEAGLIKTKYGLGLSKKQREITEALDPVLAQIIKEIRRMIRYYEDRYGTERPIGQVVTLGGGANMPGLSEYLTNNLRIPVRSFDPWQYFSYSGLQPPTAADKSMYATVAGLSLINPKEVFGS
ncbi:MAG TPA: type IV pilus assembly protein PilM [Candidatus Saccharimonadales bacterium]|nr:type IV pilus assembly protein PilM [Candidatus Saccharimonadales bacterium]